VKEGLAPPAGARSSLRHRAQLPQHRPTATSGKARRARTAACRCRCSSRSPTPTRRAQLLLQGDALWNAGIFLARADVLLAALEQHAPDILASCRGAMESARREASGTATSGAMFVRPDRMAFEACRAQSIDYAVLERHKDVAVVPFRGQWSDVGSWNAVADLTPADAEQNRIVGQGWTHGASNNFIHAPHRPVVVLGAKDLLIIDTPDAGAGGDRSCAEQVKDVVAKLEKANSAQASLHRKVVRPLGLVRQRGRGRALPGQAHRREAGRSLSLQKHHHRADTGSWSAGTRRSRAAARPSCWPRTSRPTSRSARCTGCTTPARWNSR
jgi:mannose-1-phosphate guanylyltransferase/mannose-6-phosphate isomerase